MKMLLISIAVLISTAAVAADGQFTCNFVSDGKGTKVWQCTPPPGWTAVSGQQTKTVPDKK